jgi:MraZ protein
MYTAKVDDKGRLKLPAVFLEYLQSLGASKAFITTIDMTTCKIYTISAWNANLQRMEEMDDRDLAEDYMDVASHWGQDSELDPQGRLMLPTNLRRQLDMENAQVCLKAKDGVIDVVNEEVYRERIQGASDRVKGKLSELRQKRLL